MKERISALLDGNLDAQAVEPVLNSVGESADVRRQWDHYCLIGDALRNEPELSCDLSVRVMASLAQEPTVLAPLASRPPTSASPLGKSWGKLLPLAASVAGVAVVGWLAIPQSTDTSVIQMASVAPQPLMASAVETNRQDREPLRAYLFAHQSLANQGAIPAVAPFVRTVADVSAGVRR
ncbi:sigma-E factor negative regulatory protein [Denitromonas ohlonensis]|jgi:sigma-E factor negative regulatory protein RseA|uniref:Anti-sigma 24 factor n=2 Tax=Denitromonas TaxID=139331 RepID=A0A558E4G5_9RHOO|nr:sigma-E factor negative regulatory protein [Denitromonas ohlonensis]TVT49990.1 MAG: anti-sigma 24 factor [Denitromonas halophila]TVO65786.1 anti-sigma 24 factor [Denitromonas ohlonensis]TVO79379.1 anti-sigma 24 factor [Denitromonas ohlonensis]TVT68261.1 MAG: anti-sigma 24 factor [Denitromonas halophila]TVT70269.1 MAG: anti-sigma 24 factor [Denitromonas halophila]